MDFDLDRRENGGFLGPSFIAGVPSRWYPIGSAVDAEGQLGITYGYFSKYYGLGEVEVRFFRSDLSPRQGRRVRLASGTLIGPSLPTFADDGTWSLLLNVWTGDRWSLALLRTAAPG